MTAPHSERPYRDQIIESSKLYGLIPKEAAAGLCWLDHEGRILDFTCSMTGLLGTHNLIGTLLADHCHSDDRPSIMSAIGHGHAFTTQLRVPRPDGSAVDMYVSIQPLSTPGNPNGFFATFVDITPIRRTQDLFFDKLPLAVMQLDQSQRFVYANRPAQDWLGTSLRGRSLRAIVPDDAWPAMQREQAKRREGTGGFYETEFIQQDGRRVPVQITGIPIMDANNQHAGSIGIIRNLQLDRSVEALREAMSRPMSRTQLLDLVAEHVRKIVPFDYFAVTRYSADLSEMTSVYSKAIGTPSASREVRWWKTPAPFANNLHEPYLEGDLAAIVEEPALVEFRKHPVAKRFLADGYRSVVRIPVSDLDRLDKIVAAVALYSREKARYGSRDIEMLTRELPLEKAVQMALYYDKCEEHDFRHSLLRKMAQCDEPTKVAVLLVSELAKHYRWKHVSIFRVDEALEQFCLVEQGSCSGFAIREGLTQDIHSGILGEVLQRGEGRNVRDTRLAPGYVPIHEDIRSELCMPLAWDRDRRLRLLLNVEDTEENAFSADDEATLKEIITELTPMLEKLCRQFVREAAFNLSSDAILVVDPLGRILEANLEARWLLTGSPGGDVPEHFRDLFADANDAPTEYSLSVRADRPTRLLDSERNAFEALVQISALPKDIGGGCYVTVTDYRPIRHLQQLEAIGEFYYELATQAMTPLNLVRLWLRQLADTCENGDERDLAKKALCQLQHVAITYNRMALYDEDRQRRVPTDRVPIELRDEILLLLSEFPACEAERVCVENADGPAEVQADPIQVGFILKTILAYLLRYLPPGKRVNVRLAGDRKTVCATISGYEPEEAKSEDFRDSLRWTRFSMALGEPIIRTFAQNNNATYEKLGQQGPEVTFRIAFPRYPS